MSTSPPPSTLESGPQEPSHSKHTTTIWTSPHLTLHAPSAPFHQIRNGLQRSLTSKTGHYAVILLVALDVSCSFADFLLTMYICEHAGEVEKVRKLGVGREVLGILSTMFSCLFMLELGVSVWGFGLGYFKSRFHCFDAAVIIAGFVIDITLHGVTKEVGVLVIVLRLWRVFEIIEELSAASEDQIGGLWEEIENLESERDELKEEKARLAQERDGLLRRIPRSGEGAGQDLL
ncbi:hypothetical protein FQN54_002104 [Arachnomyces sp. PD_36]|nr:hypothetical protein FQN54_002104 [Arachnomyces sp. PD_36]